MPASTLPGPHSTMCVTPASTILPDGLDPAHRRGRLAHQRLLDALGGVFDRDIDVVHHRDLRARAACIFARYVASFVSRGLHQRRMERRAHRQQHRALRALRLARLHRALDRRLLAGDHHLAGRVEVHRLHRAAGLGAGRAHRIVVEHQDRRHRALAFGHRFLHRLRAKAHQRQAVLEARARRRPPARCTRPGCGRRPSPASARRARARRDRPRSRRSPSPAAC